MKRTQVALACFLFAVSLSNGQNSPPSQTPDANQSSSSTQQSSSTTQAPGEKPPAGQPAQTGGQTQSGDSPATATKEESNGTQSGTSKDRLFFALPNFLTLENAGNVPPLTTGQKFKVVAQGSFDPIQIVWYAALSGISQAENSEPGYGQGAAGYGKRYGAYAADGTIENFFVGAIFPSMLRQDPRYFQNGHGSFFHRTGYAVSRIFVTRTDAGGSQFNYSEIIGAGVASAISTYSYHPHPGYHPGQTTPYIPSDRTLDNTLSVWGTQVGYDTLTLVIKEFWPDLRRRIKKNHPPAGGE